MDWQKAFESHVHHDPNSGCWLWAGADNGVGYGKFRGKYAHRVSYEAAKGPIPDGMHLDHLCRIRCCVNPDHLEPVTNAENARRGKAGQHMKVRPFVGQRHPRSKLTDDQAAEYGVCKATISHIATGRRTA